jgi:four helix bundle protein
MPDTPRFKPPTYENGQDIRERAFNYACDVVAFCEQLTEIGGIGRMMVPQLLDCSLSFATMLEEARAAESDADFISKCSIGLKECRESWTRLRVCERRKKGPHPAATQLVAKATSWLRSSGRSSRTSGRAWRRSAPPGKRPRPLSAAGRILNS